MNVIISNIRISYFSTWNLGDKLGKSCTLFSKSGILEDDRSKLSEMKQIYIYIKISWLQPSHTSWMNTNAIVGTFPHQCYLLLSSPSHPSATALFCLSGEKNGEWLCLSGQSCYEEVSLDPSEEIMPPLSLRPRWQKNSNVFRFYPPSWVSF